MQDGDTNIDVRGLPGEGDLWEAVANRDDELVAFFAEHGPLHFLPGAYVSVRLLQAESMVARLVAEGRLYRRQADERVVEIGAAP